MKGDLILQLDESSVVPCSNLARAEQECEAPIQTNLNPVTQHQHHSNNLATDTMLFIFGQDWTFCYIHHCLVVILLYIMVMDFSVFIPDSTLHHNCGIWDRNGKFHPLYILKEFLWVSLNCPVAVKGGTQALKGNCWFLIMTCMKNDCFFAW